MSPTNADPLLEAIDETFAFWGIDPLWYEPNEAGEERTIYWVSLLFKLKLSILTPS